MAMCCALEWACAAWTWWRGQARAKWRRSERSCWHGPRVGRVSWLGRAAYIGRCATASSPAVLDRVDDPANQDDPHVIRQRPVRERRGDAHEGDAGEELERHELVIELDGGGRGGRGMEEGDRADRDENATASGDQR
eukprot:7378430-Prymnesium_polylepis.1